MTKRYARTYTKGELIRARWASAFAILIFMPFAFCVPLSFLIKKDTILLIIISVILSIPVAYLAWRLSARSMKKFIEIDG